MCNAYFAFLPMEISLLRVAIRTLKNSSKLLEKIPKKRNRSISGTSLLAASCKTRSLNESQLISLFINLSFLEAMGNTKYGNLPNLAFNLDLRVGYFQKSNKECAFALN